MTALIATVGLTLWLLAIIDIVRRSDLSTPGKLGWILFASVLTVAHSSWAVGDTGWMVGIPVGAVVYLLLPNGPLQRSRRRHRARASVPELM